LVSLFSSLAIQFLSIYDVCNEKQPSDNREVENLLTSSIFTDFGAVFFFVLQSISWDNFYNFHKPWQIMYHLEKKMLAQVNVKGN
jgi:hypothetical protein